MQYKYLFCLGQNMKSRVNFYSSKNLKGRNEKTRNNGIQLQTLFCFISQLLMRHMPYNPYMASVQEKAPVRKGAVEQLLEQGLFISKLGFYLNVWFTICYFQIRISAQLRNIFVNNYCREDSAIQLRTSDKFPASLFLFTGPMKTRPKTRKHK